jgi:membrane associated rhomboid family serine protease
VNSINNEKYRLLEGIIYSSFVVVILWGIHMLNQSMEFDLNAYGMHPKSLEGIYGVFTMPLLHSGSSYEHIMNNSFAVLVMLSTLIYIYREIAFKVFIWSWLFTGVLTLFIAQTGSNHIGISGLTYAWVTFIFVSGLLRWDRKLMGVSMAMVVLYGGLFWGIFPIEKNMSWEGHLAGALSGIALALIFRNAPPKREKLNYEIAEEIGLEPEEKYWEIGYFEAKEKELIEQQKNEAELLRNRTFSEGQNIQVVYELKPKKEWPEEPT